MTRAAAAARELRRSLRLIRIVVHLLRGVLIAHTLLGWSPRCCGGAARWRAAVAQHWSRGLCRVLNLRVSVRGEPGSGPTLFVANHLSWLDIPCLSAALGADFVAKDEVARWPLIGAMARRAGTMFLRRGDRFTTDAISDQITWLLRRGRNVILFPEGTTSDGRSVRRFHSRLYQAALRTQAQVQAVAVSYPHPSGVHPAAPFIGDDNLARHLWTLLAEPNVDVTLTFCPALTVAGGPRRIVAEYTREQIVRALGLQVPMVQPDRIGSGYRQCS